MASSESAKMANARVVSVVPGPIVVGAGPSGLAVAASLRRLSVPSVIIERSDGIAHLWRNQTYNRLSLHLPKQFCQLPHLPFPPYFPTYPTKADFITYLLTYTSLFSLEPLFHRTVISAHFDQAASLWRVTAILQSPRSEFKLTQAWPGTTQLASPTGTDQLPEEFSDSAAGYIPSESGESMVVEYVSRWLVVATGENAEPVVPEFKGIEGFKGSIVHSGEYKNGAEYKGKRVLVVGCGNSGMEVCLDLWEHGALPSMSVRSGVHVLPREMFGKSTFGLAMKLLKWLPLRVVDRLLLLMARMVVGDTERYGLKKPTTGPLELKNTTGKTPVLDVGTFSLIKNGSIKIVPEVESLTSNGAKFVDGAEMGFDSVIFATGYKSNVSSWLKETGFFSENGKPKTPYPNGWKGKNGLYCLGFNGRGLLGASADAVNIALDIAGKWKKLS